MEIRNFGPIKRASISLRPLTIFIGPSNTGKSYAAMLAHSIISSGRGAAGRRPAEPAPRGQARADPDMHKGMMRALCSLKPGKTRACPPALAAKIAGSCRRRLAARLEGELCRNFASPLQGLARRTAKRFSVELRAGDRRILRYGAAGLNLESPPATAISLRAENIPDRELDAEYIGDDEVRCRISPALISRSAGTAAARRLCDMLEEKMMPRMVPHLPEGGFYFPAARAGMLQACRAIPSSAAEGAPFGGTKGARTPRMPGVASDFVSAMINMRPVDGPCRKLGEKIEGDLLDGSIGLACPDPNGLPEMVYRSSCGGGAVPLHRASSTVCELAPITLHLKHAARRGGLLAIEEPEAHLHPRSQVRLAGHLVGLVRGGVSILITTHSAALFEAVSQYLEVGPLPPEKRRRAVGTDKLYLCADEVAPHLFERDGKGGCVARKLDMSTEEGISQGEFMDVDRMLNGINMRIEEYLQ